MEKAVTRHSSTLAWKIPWTEEPGRLQSMGSRRVGHDWATSLSLFTFMHWRRKWQPTPVFLPGESQGWGHRVRHDWSDLAAAVAGIHEGFPWLSGKESTCSVGDPDSIPGSGRSPGGGHGSPLEYPYLENPLDRGAWQAIQSIGSQRVGHKWINRAYPHTDNHEASPQSR